MTVTPVVSEETALKRLVLALALAFALLLLEVCVQIFGSASLQKKVWRLLLLLLNVVLVVVIT